MRHRVLSIADVAAYLDRSTDFVYDAIRSGRLRARMLGRTKVVLEADLDRYLDALPLAETDQPKPVPVPAPRSVDRPVSSRKRVKRLFSILPREGTA